jgi:hypothetical protein
MSETDDDGRVCRVCVFGAAEYGEAVGVITPQECSALVLRIRDLLNHRCDRAIWLRTVPDTRALYALLLEAGEKGTDHGTH